MTKWRADLNFGDTAPESFFDAIQELLGSYVSGNFQVSQLNATTLRVAAGVDNAQVAIAINGKWRFNTTNADAIDPGGSAATHTLWVTGSNNSFAAGPPEVDSTVYTFGLEIRSSGSPATALSRQIGTVEWSGSAITKVLLSIHDQSQDPVPVGTVLPYAAAVVPSGWLLCDGSEQSRATYPRLFGLLGTTHGAGNGTTTFNLPNLAGRFPLGSGSGAGLTPRTVAAKGGEEKHTLTIAELPVHDHGAVTGATTATGTISSVTETGTVGATTDTGTVGSVSVTGTIGTEQAHRHGAGALTANMQDGFITMARASTGGVSASRFSYENTAGAGAITSDYTGPNPLMGGLTDVPNVAHTHSFTSPLHSHALTMNAHAHTLVMDAHAHTFTGTSHTHPVTPQGSGTPHDTLPPFTVLHMMIRAA